MDEQLNNLIQHALDGTIDEAGSERLRKALEKDPEQARSYREMEQMFESLSALSSIDPPGDLASDVMQLLRQRESRAASPFTAPKPQLWPRLLLPLAAGLVLGILIHSVVSRITGPEPADVALVSGTLLDPGATQSLIPLQEQTFSAGGLVGGVQLSAGTDLAALKIELDSQNSLPIDLQLEVSFDGSRLQFRGLSQSASRLEFLESTEDRLHIRAKTPARVALFLSRIEDSSQTLQLTLHPPSSDPVRFSLNWPGGQH